MKHSILILMTISLFTATGFSQQNSTQKIKETIAAFVKAGDLSDDTTLSGYLDDNYRLVMNRLFGSDKITVLTKSMYLEKIKSKVFGGDNRVVTIQDIIINGNTAVAQVTLKGEKMTFISLISLVMDASSNWKLISDCPYIVKKE